MIVSTKYLDPGQKHSYCNGIVKSDLPETYEVKILEFFGTAGQFLQLSVNCQRPVDVKGQEHDAYHDNGHIQNVPDALKVSQLMNLDLKKYNM